jgi:transcriptional antiterminator NusG
MSQADRKRPAFAIGELIQVADGPFMSFRGVVEGFDREASRLKVTLSIFGRATPVELDPAQVERV